MIRFRDLVLAQRHLHSMVCHKGLIFDRKNLGVECGQGGVLVGLAFRICSALSLAFAVLITGAAAAQNQKKGLVEAPQVRSDLSPLYHASHALIVGINKYPGLPAQFQLNFAVNDAKSVRDVLVQSYGFKAENVTLLTDKEATKEAITHALNQLASSKDVQQDDRVLIYFSCHGQTVPLPGDAGEMGFLVPTDAKVDLDNAGDSAGYLDTCLPMSEVWDSLKLCPAKHILVIADACFSGLLASSRGLAASKDTIDVMLSRRARQVITAGSKGEPSTERADLGHGVFTSKFLEELTARAKAVGQVFTVSDLFATLQVGVSNATNGKQSPQLGNFDTDGEFLFAPGGVYQPAAPIKPSDAGPATTQPDAAHVATLHIDVTPANATVSVNGKPLDPGSHDFKMDLGDFANGSVNVHATADGYQAANQRVVVKRGQMSTVTIALVPAGSSPGSKPPPANHYSTSPPPAVNTTTVGGKTMYRFHREYLEGETEDFEVTTTEETAQGERVITSTLRHTVLSAEPGKLTQFRNQQTFESSTLAGRSLNLPKPGMSQWNLGNETGFVVSMTGVPIRALAFASLPARALAVGESATLTFRGGPKSLFDRTVIKITLAGINRGVAHFTIAEDVFPKDGTAPIHMDEDEQVEEATGKLIRYERTEPGFLARANFTSRKFVVVRKP